MSGITLYDYSGMLDEAIEAARAAVNPETGEMPDSWAEFLDEIEMERDEKIIHCARVIKSLSAEAEAIGSEIDRLADRRKSLDGEVRRLKDYVLGNLKPGEKVADATAAISTRSTPRVEVDPFVELPEQYVRTKIEKSPDKAAIKDALKSGVEITGCSIQHTISLVVK